MGELKELYGFVISSKIRLEILKILEKQSPLMQMEIARKMKKNQPDIAKAIYQLEKKGLVECLTPDKGSYKPYAITKLGRDSLHFKLD